MIVGFDTEFQGPDHPLNPEDVFDGKAKNLVLCYQFGCRTSEGATWTGIACPDEGQRISLGEFLVLALGSGVQGGHVKQLPTKVILAGAFTRADIPAFSDFSDLQSLIANVRNSFISLDQFISFDLRFEGGQTVRIQAQLRDTMLLAPAGLRSLADIGEIVGLPKITLDPDPVKERQIKGQMHLLRRTIGACSGNTPSMMLPYA